MAIKLNTYEEGFVEALVRSHPLDESYVRGIVSELIALFEGVPDTADVDADVFGGDFQVQRALIDFSQRSVFYEREASGYVERLVQDPDSDPQLWAEAAYATVPWFAQELEGTVKLALQTIAYFSEIDGEVSVPLTAYRESKCRHLQNAIDKVRSSAGSGGNLRRLVDELDPPDEEAGAEAEGVKINHLRRAVAHSDFVFHPADPPSIVFFDEAHHEFPVLGFLELFLRFQALVKTRNVSFHLGMKRLTGEPDVDVPPSEIYGSPG